jgi:hypothetical protein
MCSERPRIISVHAVSSRGSGFLFEPAPQEVVVGRAGGDAGLLRSVEDGLPLLLVQRAVGPGDLHERDEGERGHDLRPDAERDQPVDDRAVPDPDQP